MKTRYEIESIKRGQKKLRITLIMCAVFLFLLATIITLAIIFGGIGNSPTITEKPEILDGEDIYYGLRVAYPAMATSDIYRITVNNGSKNGGEFTFVKDEQADGDFMMTYVEDGEIKIFYPSICDAIGVEYSDLYAIETEDGYNAITRINYLLNAFNAMYFSERIPLSSDETERAAQLEGYGFNSDNRAVVSFDYVDSKTAKVVNHKITIGEKTVTGGGFYFTVDNRDYVYCSASPYFEYALLGFYSYVNTTLIAEGLDGDSTYEPTLTSNFTHWLNTMHEMPTEPGAQIPTVQADSTLIVEAATLVPITPSDYLEYPSLYNENKSGYNDVLFEDIEIQLYTGSDDSKIKTSLVGKQLGKLYDTKDASASMLSSLIYTLPVTFSTSHQVDLSNRESAKYSYKIVEIEAIVTDSEDITAEGSEIKATDSIRVAYYYTAEGKTVTPLLCHAVLDLTSPALPSSAVEKVVAAGVGTPLAPIEFDVVYTAQNALETPYKTIVTEIVSITDDKGAAMTEVTEETQKIMYRYALLINGKISGEEYLTQSTLSSLNDEEGMRIKSLFMGKKVSDGLNITLEEGVVYNEAFRNFMAYVISDLKYFITHEQIVSFSYVNYSDRDPFYGEAIYKNNTEGYKLYGLDGGHCDYVIKLLGGLGESSTTSLGLKGEQIVSVGITPEKLKEAGDELKSNGEKAPGCYAHTIYFELPRGVVTVNSENTNVPADYIAAETLGFTLYISDIQSDGTRIIASDQYNVIAKVDASGFEFLDKSFSEFWARDNILMVNSDKIHEIKVDLMMEDIKGSYQLLVAHTDGYITDENFVIGAPPEDYIDTYVNMTVNVIPSGDCTPNKLTELVAGSDKYYASLDTLYELTVQDEDAHNKYLPDSLGTTFFKEFILSMFYVDRVGGVDKATQDDIIANGKMLMKFSIKIDTDGDGSAKNEDYYTYEFYHFKDENKVLVRLYEEDGEGNMLSDGAVADCYISRMGFKRMVSTFISLMNGEEFNIGEKYPEFS